MKAGKGAGSIIIAVSITLELTPRSSPALPRFSFTHCEEKKKCLQPRRRGAIYSRHPSSVFRGGAVPGGGVQGERTGAMREGVGGGEGGGGGGISPDHLRDDPQAKRG